MFAGFDLGAKLGYAFLSDDGKIAESGVLRLGKRTPEAIKEAYEFIGILFARHTPIIVGYEKVKFFGRGVQAAHAYGSYEAVLWLLVLDFGSLLEQFTVQQVKKLATGKANAIKHDMVAQALMEWKHLPDDDNEADALWIAECTRRKFLGLF